MTLTARDVLAYCLSEPGAWEDEPWEGDVVTKAADRIFAFVGDGTAVGVKCGTSRDEADEWLLRYPEDARVMAYIGRFGWNTLELGGASPTRRSSRRSTRRTRWSSPDSPRSTDQKEHDVPAASFQVTFDAEDPERIAGFWASALGYRSDQPPEGFGSWPEFLDSIGVPEDKRDSAFAIVDPDAVKPRLLFQKVPEAKTVKNRVHLDIHATVGVDREAVDDRREDEVRRLESLGATRHEQRSDMGVTWVVMSDPEGNEFCVS